MENKNITPNNLSHLIHEAVHNKLKQTGAKDLIILMHPQAYYTLVDEHGGAIYGTVNNLKFAGYDIKRSVDLEEGKFMVVVK